MRDSVVTCSKTSARLALTPKNVPNVYPNKNNKNSKQNFYIKQKA